MIRKLQRLRWLVLATVALAIATLVAPTTEAQAPRRGGSLRVASIGEPDNLDPHLLLSTQAMRIMEEIYSSLLRLDEKLNLHPDLATSWEISPDAKAYVFKLRRGVKFHHGREFVADDVKFSIDRMRDPKVASPWGYLFEDLDRVEVTDPYTVRVIMKKPSSQLLTMLASPLTAMVPRDMVEKQGDLKKGGSGTGPFKFVEWVPQQYVRLVRNPAYYARGMPYLDELIFVPVTDETSRVTSVLAGTNHMDIQVAPKHFEQYRRSGKVDLMGGEVVSYIYIGFNTRKAPFSDWRVRQAVAWTVDRQQVVQLSAFGQGRPLLGGPLPAGTWMSSGLVVYDRPKLDKAKRLLAEAGYPQGVKGEVTVGAGTVYVDVAQVIKQQLQPAGIDLEIKVLEGGAVSRAVWKEHSYQMNLTHWGTLVDPDEFLYAMFHTKGGWNPTGFGDSKLDEILEAGRRVLKQDERRKIYRDAEQRIAELAPYVFLFRPIRYAAIAKEARGLKHEMGNTRLLLREVWMVK
ncbi:MAG: hypothetical protein HY660_11200 [Armatimonadetes bacterium]|nr:hypothetical protein [Armatimonadota bacterium]